MPRGLRRFHQSPHFITFSCYRRQPNFVDATVYDLFPLCLEEMRRRFDLRVYGYVVMPEHVHLLLSEPEHGTPEQILSWCIRVEHRCSGAFEGASEFGFSR
jgi:putative transposase